MYRLPLEITVLQISNKEHDEMHVNPTKWVNAKKVFPKEVRKAEIPDHPKRAADCWIVTVVHFPHCAAMGSCDPA